MRAFSAAEWVQVDKTVRNTALNAALESFEKKDYLTMPMSVLYLFNRPQDYGFAHAEPVRVAMSRNHLRICLLAGRFKLSRGKLVAYGANYRENFCGHFSGCEHGAVSAVLQRCPGA